MSIRLSFGVFTLFACLAISNRLGAREDDPIIDGTPLSKLVEKFKAAKNGNERSEWAIAIARGREKSVSAVPLLAAALKDKERVVRANVAQALGTMGPIAKAAVPDLISTLKDTDASVRATAAYSLGSISSEPKTVVPALSEVLKNSAEQAEVRAAAAASLGSFASEAKAVTPVLQDSLKDQKARVRVAAAGGLYRLDKSHAKAVVPVLREILKDKDENAQTLAVFALKAMGSDAKEAVADLIEVLRAPSMTSYYAREALGKIPEAESALVAALKSPDKDLQTAAAGVLREYFPEAAKKAGLNKK